MSLTICPWKYDKQWVYSITYDEALVEWREAPGEKKEHTSKRLERTFLDWREA